MTLIAMARRGAASLILVAGLSGLSGCLGGEDDGSPGGGDSTDVTGTWMGPRTSRTHVSGGCGGNTAMDTAAFTVTTTLVQTGSTVAGTASVEGQTFTILNGSVSGATFTFSVDIPNEECSAQANAFICDVHADHLACGQTETHCDSCSGGAYVTHTLQQTFEFARQ